MKNRKFISPISEEIKEKGFFSLGGLEKDIERQEELKNIPLEQIEREINELEKILE